MGCKRFGSCQATQQLGQIGHDKPQRLSHPTSSAPVMAYALVSLAAILNLLHTILVPSVLQVVQMVGLVAAPGAQIRSIRSVLEGSLPTNTATFLITYRRKLRTKQSPSAGCYGVGPGGGYVKEEVMGAPNGPVARHNQARPLSVRERARTNSLRSDGDGRRLAPCNDSKAYRCGWVPSRDLR